MNNRFLTLFVAIIISLVDALGADSGSSLGAAMQDKYDSALKDTRTGNHVVAFKEWIEYLDMAAKHPEKTDNEKLQTAYIALATIHFNFQDYESALDFNRRGIELAESIGDRKSSIRFLNNMVGCYAETGQFDKATKCNVEMRARSKELETNDYDYNFEFNNGYIAKKRGRWDDAVGHYKKALRQIDVSGMDTMRRVYPYSEIFSVYDLSERLDSALVYLLKYRQYADKPILQKDCYRELMRIYARLGDNEKCLESQREYFHLTDSVLNERDFIETRNQYQNRLKAEREGHITVLEGRVSRLGRMLVAGGCALLVIGVVAFLIWRQKRRLDSAYTDLYERNKELLAMHSELVRERQRQRAPEAVAASETPAQQVDDEPDSGADVNPELLAKIRDVFDTTEMCLNPDFSLQALAKAVGSNTKYVSQAINDAMGCNFRSLVNEYRIKEAQRRMLDTANFGHMTIQGIAESVGYKSATNFIATFKKATGITPSLFMKKARENRS